MGLFSKKDKQGAPAAQQAPVQQQPMPQQDGPSVNTKSTASTQSGEPGPVPGTKVIQDETGQKIVTTTTTTTTTHIGNGNGGGNPPVGVEQTQDSSTNVHNNNSNSSLNSEGLTPPDPSVFSRNEGSSSGSPATSSSSVPSTRNFSRPSRGSGLPELGNKIGQAFHGFHGRTEEIRGNFNAGVANVLRDDEGRRKADNVAEAGRHEAKAMGKLGASRDDAAALSRAQD